MKPVEDEKEAEASRQDCFVKRVVVTAVPFVGVVVISSLNNVLQRMAFCASAGSCKACGGSMGVNV